MEIIPAIDIMDGKCVRLTQGDYAQKKIYNAQPLELAKQFEDAGIRRLHLVDLDGARSGAVVNLAVLETLATNTKLVIDFGGGIKTSDDLENVFTAGAQYATIGSMAAKEEDKCVNWLQQYGSRRFLLGADVRAGMIAVNGWQETTQIGILDFIANYTARGITQFFCTDISKDGKLEGPAIALYRSIIEKFPGLPCIASGGVASMNDLQLLKDAGCSGAIIGKAIYENRISLTELKTFMQ